MLFLTFENDRFKWHKYDTKSAENHVYLKVSNSCRAILLTSTDLHKMDEQININIELFTTAISNNKEFNDKKIISTVLLPREHLEPFVNEKKIEDKILAWFFHNGFVGDRTRRNYEGYPSIISSFFNYPSWIDFTPDDMDGNISESRSKEIRPLIMQFQEYQYELIEIFRQQISTKWDEQLSIIKESKTDLYKKSVSLSPTLNPFIELSVKDFKNHLVLIDILGAEKALELYEAIIDIDPTNGFDHYGHEQTGVPDLLIWHPDPTKKLWFFVEVKSSNDSLHQSQLFWINNNWKIIDRKFIIIKIA